MAQQSTTVEVKILDKEYLVACPEEEQEGCCGLADDLSELMHEIR